MGTAHAPLIEVTTERISCERKFSSVLMSSIFTQADVAIDVLDVA